MSVLGDANTAALADRLQLDPARVADEIAHVGNTGAASIPLALHAARQQGRVPDEGLLLLTAFGAGFAAGALLIELRPNAEEQKRRGAVRPV